MNSRNPRTWTINLAPSRRLVTVALATALAILGAAAFSLLLQHPARTASAAVAAETKGNPMDVTLEFNGQSTGAVGLSSISGGVSTPREASTGQATGRRQYQPFVMTHGIDANTPSIFKGLVENQTVKATIHMGGLTIVLTNARVSEDKLQTGPNGNATEQFSLVYQAISIEGFGRTVEDNFSSQR
jgi:type VI secretion system secreted protein Hcp